MDRYHLAQSETAPMTTTTAADPSLNISAGRLSASSPFYSVIISTPLIMGALLFVSCLALGIISIVMARAAVTPLISLTSARRAPPAQAERS